jgi:hypothetical protein
MAFEGREDAGEDEAGGEAERSKQKGKRERSE